MVGISSLALMASGVSSRAFDLKNRDQVLINQPPKMSAKKSAVNKSAQLLEN